MENAIIFIGIGGLAWIIIDIFSRGNKTVTASPEPPAEDPEDFLKLFDFPEKKRSGFADHVRGLKKIERLYNAMKPKNAPDFEELTDEQIEIIFKKYKGES